MVKWGKAKSKKASWKAIKLKAQSSKLKAHRSLVKARKPGGWKAEKPEKAGLTPAPLRSKPAQEAEALLG
jgi:hypothetical protein